MGLSVSNLLSNGAMKLTFSLSNPTFVKFNLVYFYISSPVSTFEKEVYCFAPVVRSLDQGMTAQYLLTPSLENCQTWYSGCLQKVDDPY